MKSSYQAYNNYNDLQESTWEINTGFELSRVTVAMLDSDNDIHQNTRCYPVDADSCRIYS